MVPYIYAAIVAIVMILISALISNAIKYEGGSNPKDPGMRKTWFWVIAIVNPIVCYLIGMFVLAPNANNDQIAHDEFMTGLAIGTGIGFVLYILIGFILSKMLKNGKIGNWF